jgi:hypothetical protein
MPPNEPQLSSVVQTPQSFLEVAGDLIGCLDGPGGLSTNPKYFAGFGRDRQTILTQLNEVDSTEDAGIYPEIRAMQYASFLGSRIQPDYYA